MRLSSHDLSSPSSTIVTSADALTERLDGEAARLATRLQSLAHPQGNQTGEDRGVHMLCRFCEARLTSHPLQTFRPLPSAVLDDVSDYLLCYKQSILPLASIEVESQRGMGLCGDAYLLIHAQDLVEGAVPSAIKTDNGREAVVKADNGREAAVVEDMAAIGVRRVCCPRCMTGVGEQDPQVSRDETLFWGGSTSSMT